MQRNSIQELLEELEGKTLEFKRDLSSLKPILKTIIAFANTAGGTLIIGRDASGELVGVDDPLAEEEKLANSISDSIFPALMPDMEITTIKGKALLLIRVPHQQGPFYLKNEGFPQGIYIRLGSTSRRSPPEIVTELQRAQSGLSFDQLPCGGYLTGEALDKNKTAKFLETLSKGNKHECLETLGVLIHHSGRLLVSNGGLIVFGNDKERMRYFPHARIMCARFKGTNKSVFIDRQDMEGTILEAIEPTLKFIQRNTRLGSEIRSIKRRDISEYPDIAIREVLTNALAHADYSLSGSIQVAIFDDRLEIQNPGMFPFGLTLEKFKRGVSHIRNHVIVRVFRELKLMEEWGSGYTRCVSYCEDHGYPEPEWEELGSVVRVIFRPHSLFYPVASSALPAVPVNDPVNLELNERQVWFLKELHKGEKLKSSHLSKHWRVSKNTSKRDIAGLLKHHFIEHVGSTRGGYYRIPISRHNGPIMAP